MTCSQNCIHLVLAIRLEEAGKATFWNRMIMKNIKQYCILIIFFLFCGLPTSTSAVSCKELNTPEKIKSFMKESHQSNPLLRKNVVWD